MSARLEVAWERSLHLRGGAVALRDEGPLIVTERHSHLVRLDPLTGHVGWDVGGVPGVPAVVAIGDTAAVVHDAHGSVRCVDLIDGRQRWSAAAGGRHTDFVTVHSSVAVSGSWRGYERVHARAVRDGDVLWRHRRPVAGGLVPPQAIDRGILTGRRTDPVLMLIDPLSGEQLDEWLLPGPVHCSDLRPSPFTVNRDGSVVFVCEGDHVMALDASGTLDQLWQHPVPLATAPPYLTQRHLWITERSGGVAAIDVAAQQVVATSPGSEPAVAVLSGMFPDDVVLVGASGLVRALHADGAEVARVSLPGHLELAVARLPGIVHVLGKGRLTALRFTRSDAE